MFCDPLPLQLLSKIHFFSNFWHGVDLPPSYLDNVFKYTVFFFDGTPKQACMHNMVLGDLNCHFLIQTHFTSIIENFFNDLDFIIYWENQVQAEDNLIHTVDYTYHQVQNGESFVFCK